MLHVSVCVHLIEFGAIQLSENCKSIIESLRKQTKQARRDEEGETERHAEWSSLSSSSSLNNMEFNSYKPIEQP